MKITNHKNGIIEKGRVKTKNFWEELMKDTLLDKIGNVKCGIVFK